MSSARVIEVLIGLCDQASLKTTNNGHATIGEKAEGVKIGSS